MTPLASVAMLEKLALLKIARWSAPAFSSASSACPCKLTSAALLGGPLFVLVAPVFCAMLLRCSCPDASTRPDGKGVELIWRSVADCAAIQMSSVRQQT